jgi:hypothetical protein
MNDMKQPDVTHCQAGWKVVTQCQVCWIVKPGVIRRSICNICRYQGVWDHIFADGPLEGRDTIAEQAVGQQMPDMWVLPRRVAAVSKNRWE